MLVNWGLKRVPESAIDGDTSCRLLTPDTSQVTLPSPATVEKFTALERLNPGEYRPVSKFAPGILVKFAWDYNAEIRALQFVHGRLSVRAPRVLHHAPFLNRSLVDPWKWMDGAWYFYMDECQGVPLDTVIDRMSPAELDHIADQLLDVLKEMCSCPGETLGSVTGSPYDNWFMPFPWSPPHAFKNTMEYLDCYREMFLDICGPEYVEELFSHFPTDTQVHLTHGDLLPHNILVDGSKIVAVIDWETAGYYPEFWEYCRMHDPGLVTPGWGHVLARIFPGLHREKEIDAMYRITRYIKHNRPGVG